MFVRLTKEFLITAVLVYSTYNGSEKNKPV